MCKSVFFVYFNQCVKNNISGIHILVHNIIPSVTAVPLKKLSVSILFLPSSCNSRTFIPPLPQAMEKIFGNIINCSRFKSVALTYSGFPYLECPAVIYRICGRPWIKSSYKSFKGNGILCKIKLSK